MALTSVDGSLRQQVLWEALQDDVLDVAASASHHAVANAAADMDLQQQQAGARATRILSVLCLSRLT